MESTSRRTGLELGLAAVTEANRGDIAVKLKSKRDRSVEEIMAELRAEIAQQEPQVEVEFVQVLQDMIGDLSNAPEPVQIKLFSPDAALLSEWAPKVARCDRQSRWRGGYAERHRQYDQRAGHGVSRESHGCGPRRIHAGGSGGRRQRDSGRRTCGHSGHRAGHRVHHPGALSRRQPRFAWTP